MAQPAALCISEPHECRRRNTAGPRDRRLVGPGRGAYGWRRGDRSVTRPGRRSSGTVPWTDCSVSQIATYSYRPFELSGVDRCESVKRVDAVGGAVTPPTAFQSVSEQLHEPGSNGPRRAAFCRSAYTVSCRSSVRMLPDPRSLAPAQRCDSSLRRSREETRKCAISEAFLDWCASVAQT
jgi:hypothetical protein